MLRVASVETTDSPPPVTGGTAVPHLAAQGYVRYIYRVSRGLYRSSCPTRAMLAELKAHGVRAVLSFRDPALEGRRAFVDRAIANAMGLSFKDIAVPDDRAPTVAQMRSALDFVRRQVTDVHCIRGIGRTGVFVACYRLAVQGWSVERALAEARTFRLRVPAQVAFIRHFAAELAAGRVAGYPISPKPA